LTAAMSASSTSLRCRLLQLGKRRALLFCTVVFFIWSVHTTMKLTSLSEKVLWTRRAAQGNAQDEVQHRDDFFFGVEAALKELTAIARDTLKLKEECATAVTKATEGPLTVVKEHEDIGPITLLKPCPAHLPSKQWSCIRKVSPYEVSMRDPTKYGFQPQDWPENMPPSYRAASYDVFEIGDTMDHRRDFYQPIQIKMTKDGYGLIDMPPGLHELLLDFKRDGEPSGKFQERWIDRQNNFVFPTHMIDLNYPPPTCRRDTRRAVTAMVQDVLEKWAGQRLQATAIYGIRIYPRHSMMLNHVDRAGTHIVSAILNVAQEGEAGWPLELIHEDGEMLEAYIQPGQMLMYEGHRVLHGRPMRYEGDMFANVFIHFKPLIWRLDCRNAHAIDPTGILQGECDSDEASGIFQFESLLEQKILNEGY